MAITQKDVLVKAKALGLKRTAKAPVYRRQGTPNAYKPDGLYDEKALAQHLQRLESSIRNSSGKIRDDKSARVFAIWRKELTAIAKLGPKSFVRDPNYAGALRILSLPGWSSKQEYKDRMESLHDAVDELKRKYASLY